jgi:Flp pilus assembly protein TadG
MSKRPGSRDPLDQRGQILVIFALSLVAITAMVGLILDGGSAFAQRRAEQNAADLAALAAANDLIVNQGSADWQGTALEVARLNGYEHGKDGTTVTVTCHNCPGQALDAAFDGVQVTVDIAATHRNAFAGVVGMPTWEVGVTATSKTGWPNTATGPGPFIVSKDAFDDSGFPSSCTDADNPCELTHADADTPSTATEFAWTDFGYDKPCEVTGNVDDDALQDYLDDQGDFTITVDFGCYIAQHNLGVMNNIVARLETLVPMTFPVPIVDAAGRFVGFASFVMTGAKPLGENSTISGYFESEFQEQRLDVRSPGFGTATFGGSYVLKLIN